MDQIFQRAEETNRDLEKADLILCDDGWRDGSSARIMPEVAEKNDLIGGDHWRESSDFAVVSSELDGRRPSVETLLERLGGSPSPTPPEWANTVEHLAARIGSHDVEATWDDFLASVNVLLPRELRLLPRGPASDPLGGAKFLPTADGRLLSASDTARVFFQPRRGFDDAADFVDAVPDSLQDRIAFLHEDVTTHEGPQSQRTDVREFLGRNGRADLPKRRPAPGNRDSGASRAAVEPRLGGCRPLRRDTGLDTGAHPQPRTGDARRPAEASASGLLRGLVRRGRSHLRPRLARPTRRVRPSASGWTAPKCPQSA